MSSTFLLHPSLPFSEMKSSGSGYDDAVWYQSDAFHKPPFMLYKDGPEEQKEVAGEGTGYVNEKEVAEGDDSDFEFEFSLPAMEEKSPTISADEIFHNGQIRPLFPVFDADWRSDIREGFFQASDSNSNSNSDQTKSIRLPLRKLMLNSEQETSCSSSEADDLEGASPETYCVWIPPKQEMSKKSKSTGSSSKRWKLRNLVHRSHSDGRDSLVSLTPKQHQQHDKKTPAREKLAAETTAVGKAHREHYVKNREMREKDRKKSYLPYRQDVMGLFANVNGLSRTVQPF